MGHPIGNVTIRGGDKTLRHSKEYNQNLEFFVWSSAGHKHSCFSVDMTKDTGSYYQNQANHKFIDFRDLSDVEKFIKFLQKMVNKIEKENAKEIANEL